MHSRRSLAEWLDWIERLHPRTIDLGLERVRRVATALGIGAAFPCPVVTVAGTNGKGSSVALLEAILAEAGYRVAVYTSPHLLRYNERVRIDGREASDDELCAAFARIEDNRDGVSLTYFEFATLAAFDLFVRSRPDVAVLEVGLGGRLDAVNLIDSDVALVTSISIDHVDWLGPDRESIGAEKAGVFRPGRPAVCSDPAPPQSVLAVAARLGAPLYRLGHEFGCRRDAGSAGAWSWWAGGQTLSGLPPPALAGRFQYGNAAGALMALDLLGGMLGVERPALEAGLRRAFMPGRFQRLAGDRVPCILDVAHNAGGAQALAQALIDEPTPGRTRAVAAILGDKDAAGMVAALAPAVDEWYVAGLAVERGTPAAKLRDCVESSIPGAGVTVCADVLTAYRTAQSASLPGDRVVVFGSFYTVAEILRARAASDVAGAAT